MDDDREEISELSTEYSRRNIREPNSRAIDSINNWIAYVVSNDGAPLGIDADIGTIQEKAISPDFAIIILHRRKPVLQKKEIIIGSCCHPIDSGSSINQHRRKSAN